MELETTTLVTAAGLAGVAAIARQRRHDDADGVVAVTALAPPAEVTRATGGARRVGPAGRRAGGPAPGRLGAGRGRTPVPR